MCTNQKWITNRVTGCRVLVKCGKCDACQQEKANKRTTRINLNNVFGVSSSYTTLFVTLTYDSKNVPFIFQKDFRKFVNFGLNALPVYRMSYRHLGKNKSKRALKTFDKIASFANYDMPNMTKIGLQTSTNCYVQNMMFEFGSTCFDGELPELVKHSYMQGTKICQTHDVGKVGVLLYDDVQKFLKRLRINLKRHYNYENKFDFFCCGEYGPRTYRPHYHILFTLPTSAIAFFKQAIVESWKFDNLADKQKQQKQIKVADNGVSSYVSSYVNCSSDFPFFLRTFRPFRQKHVYSQGYGMRSEYCSLPKVLEMARQRMFDYERTCQIGDAKSYITVPLPSYVINRYFPQFKGFSRLTTYEVVVICQNPARLFDYVKTLDYTLDEIKSISISLRNHYLKYCSLLKIPVNDFTLEQYAIDFVNCWKSFSSYLIKLAYEKITDLKSYLYHFLNWSDYIWSDFLSDVINGFPDSEPLICDPNKYEDNILYSDYLKSLYDGYNKSRKLKNLVYSLNNSNI